MTLYFDNFTRTGALRLPWKVFVFFYFTIIDLNIVLNQLTLYFGSFTTVGAFCLHWKVLVFKFASVLS